MFVLLAAVALIGEPDSLRIAVAGRETVVPVRAEAQATLISADAVANALGGSVERLAHGRFVVHVSGTRFEFSDRLPYVVVEGRVFSLAVSPRERNGHLEVPVQFFVDVVPRVRGELRWDPVRRTLSSAGRSAGATPSVASTPVASVTAPPTTVESAPPRTPRRRVIVVDAGHGGRDPGMRGWRSDQTPVREKDITLGIALQLEKEMQRRGYGVVMTRRADTLIALDDRGRIANRNKGDLFISIHVNAANPRWKEPHAARGFETYFLAEAKTEDERRVAQMENEVVRFETEADAPKNDPLGFIINDMAQNEHLRESNDLAASVQDALRRVHPGPSRGVKQAGFRVLVTAYMPAVLVEVGFGTNGADAAYMSSDDGQRALATAIADAASEYLARYEQRIGVGGAR